MTIAEMLRLPDPEEINEKNILIAVKKYAHALLELTERFNDRNMRIIKILVKLN